MSDDEAVFVDEFVARFVERAEAVRNAGMPPLEGVARVKWRQQRQLDYQDFAMVGDCDASLDGGVLTLVVDLRPRICDAGLRGAGVVVGVG
tara:strand:+ start:626 stop:898 length:273 start_codon:yes stop_codon:yes gene_type:complete